MLLVIPSGGKGGPEVSNIELGSKGEAAIVHIIALMASATMGDFLET